MNWVGWNGDIEAARRDSRPGYPEESTRAWVMVEEEETMSVVRSWHVTPTVKREQPGQWGDRADGKEWNAVVWRSEV